MNLEIKAKRHGIVLHIVESRSELSANTGSWMLKPPPESISDELQCVLLIVATHENQERKAFELHRAQTEADLHWELSLAQPSALPSLG